MNPSPLRCLFEPGSIAVVGVSRDEAGVGRRVFRNLRDGGFRGALHGINPKAERLDGQPMLSSLTALPGPVDVAIIAVPAEHVVAVVEECAKQQIEHAVVLSAGFAEIGDEGRRRQEQLVQKARALGVRLLGPNCLGLMRASINLNASFSRGIGRPGTLSLISQSGAICSAIVDWAEERRIGLSTVVSLGAAVDIGAGELLDYFAFDPETHAILIYAEGVDHARAFMSGMRAAARKKPVIVIKAGRQGAGHRAAASHTGAIVGDDAVFDAALRRAGAVRVATLEQLFAAADVLAHSTRAEGDRLLVITNAGGLGVLAADRAADLGVPLAQLTDSTRAALERCLPPHASRDNPVDVLGDAPPDRYAQALELCLADPHVDGITVLLSPQAMTDPEAAARVLVGCEREAKKPILAAFLGGSQIRAAEATLIAGEVACFDSPEASVEAFATLATFFRNQRQLLQLPGPAPELSDIDAAPARDVIARALREGRTTLTQLESFAVLDAFGIERVATDRASSLETAVAVAERVGFPVALKIDSPDITHKTDVGGVVLGLKDQKAVRAAHADLLARVESRAPSARLDGVIVQAMLEVRQGRELLVGIQRDRALGPVIAVSAGGTLVELMGGGAVELVPLNALLARELWQRSRAAKLLGSFRGNEPANTAVLEQILLRLSVLASELPEVRELDINPLLIGPDGAIALDARIILEPAAPARQYAHLAIAPCPSFARTLALPDGASLFVRALRPEDGELEASFIRGLSFRSRYFRFMHGVREPSARTLERLTQLDYDRELALVASIGEGDAHAVAAIARYAIDLDRKSCELGMAVADAFQGRGIGSALIETLIESAAGAGIPRMHASVLTTNAPMLALLRRLGFELHMDATSPELIRATRSL